MTLLECASWASARRTSVRNIRAGDVFAFTVPDRGYGYGRVIARVSIGHTAEIFTTTVAEPTAALDPDTLEPAGPPIVIDTYSLLDRKSEGDYRVIAHEASFRPGCRYDGVFFGYGAGTSLMKVNVFGNRSPAAAQDVDSLPRYSPQGDKFVQRLLAQATATRKTR